MHMIAYDGDTQGLFRAAFMQSGSPIPVGDLEGGQKCALQSASRNFLVDSMLLQITMISWFRRAALVLTIHSLV